MKHILPQNTKISKEGKETTSLIKIRLLLESRNITEEKEIRSNYPSDPLIKPNKLKRRSTKQNALLILSLHCHILSNYTKFKRTKNDSKNQKSRNFRVQDLWRDGD